MAGADELEEALRRHPDWDEGLLRELARERQGQVKKEGSLLIKY
ncbi:MAG: hypothetical protein RXO54_02390 [Acidilobus sp.]